MKNHTELLNYLAEKYKLKSYLEIGVQNPANNFDKINAEYKLGLDPEIEYRVNQIEVRHNVGDMTFINVIVQDKLLETTSDDYFKVLGGCINNKANHYDLIFIDGYHEAEQVKRDFENSLRCLNDGGFIVIHDTLPEDEPGTRVPRETKRWWGDVYKFAMKLGQYENIDFITFDFDNGCTVVWKSVTGIRQAYDGGYTFDDYLKHRGDLLRIKPITDIEKYL